MRIYLYPWLSLSDGHLFKGQSFSFLHRMKRIFSIVMLKDANTSLGQRCLGVIRHKDNQSFSYYDLFLIVHHQFGIRANTDLVCVLTNKSPILFFFYQQQITRSQPSPNYPYPLSSRRQFPKIWTRSLPLVHHQCGSHQIATINRIHQIQKLKSSQVQKKRQNALCNTTNFGQKAQEILGVYFSNLTNRS